jgi:tryptophan-rich sensory protein
VNRRTLVPVAVGVGAALLVAGVGATMTDLGPWYRALRQPGWSPPDWAFPVGWTTVYAFTVAAGVSAWRAAHRGAERTRLVTLFAFNAFLNILWSLIFFRLHRPDWALVEVAVFWLSIVLLIVVAARRSPTARLLLLPYLSWVSFASALNAAVVALNPPFS